MKDYIINIPHLQSLTERLSGKVITLICWLMWVYLLLPILILLDWLRGDNKVINEMHWFGGHRSLFELLQIYTATLLVLVIAWIIWIIGHKYCTDHWRPAPAENVTDEEMCEFFHVDAEKLHHCREQQHVTAFFDEHGKIINIEAYTAPHV